ncbi:TRAP transporter large permease [Cohnella massiliensis]|uniref:TRAP transporter large permease n=1 Tax=Cohnella massiliensis TaxID=1816691 RepID=UPI0009B974DE|nr:TRAP transporter large permease subunit [Cohnella massiliensis]
MDWWIVLPLIFGALMLLFALGIPILFSFLIINMIGAYLLWGGTAGLQQLPLNMFKSVSLFSLLAIPMFLFMGEIMFRTGIGSQVFHALGKWMGRLPGRLSVLAVGSGTLFAVLCGSSVATTSLLGSLLVPEMEKKGYKPSMTLGPIVGSAGLAILIPPTALGVLMATLASIPVGNFLIAIVLPGLILAAIFFIYVVVRSLIEPDAAPTYDVETVSLKEKLGDFFKYIFPLGFIVFLVLGVIVLGVATPTQSAVLGATGTIVMALAYRKLTWKLLWESLTGTARMTVMILMIMVGSATFSQILSYTGVTQGLVEAVGALNLSPVMLIIVVQLVLIVLGCFLEPLSIMMMTLPIVMPLVHAMGIDPVWFCVIFLINMQMATMTPPFGMDLFAMKAAAPQYSMGTIYKAIFPFILMNLLLIALLVAFPPLATWLTGFIRM